MNFIRLPSGQFINLAQVTHISTGGMVYYSNGAPSVLNDVDKRALNVWMQLSATDLNSDAEYREIVDELEAA